MVDQVILPSSSANGFPCSIVRTPEEAIVGKALPDKNGVRSNTFVWQDVICLNAARKEKVKGYEGSPHKDHLACTNNTKNVVNKIFIE